MGIFIMVSAMLISIILGTIILLTTNNFGIAIAVAIAVLMISHRDDEEGDEDDN